MHLRMTIRLEARARNSATGPRVESSTGSSRSLSTVSALDRQWEERDVHVALAYD